MSGIPPRRAAIAALAASALMGAVLAAQTVRDGGAPPPSGTASIAGRVVTGAPGQPVPVRRARVTLDADGRTTPLVTDTDTDGKYRFDALPAGTFRVTAEKAGFVPASGGLPHGIAPAPSIELKAGQAATADLVMERGAALEGRIANTNGDPAINVVVSAVRLGYGPNGRRPVMVRQVRTDDQGRFRVHTLPPGEYFVDVALDPLQAYSEPLAPGEKAAGFARTYFPGTARFDEARSVTLAVGEDVRSLDFTVTMLPMATVAGRVVDASGKVLTAGYALRLQAVGGLPGDLRAIMDQSGLFRFGSVPPGDYWLMSAATPTAGGDPQFAAMRLSIAGQDITELKVALAGGTSLSGRVEVEAPGTAVPAGLKFLTYTTGRDTPLPPGLTAAPVVVAADGSFTVKGLFGPRLLRISGLPPGWAVKGISLDGVDVTDNSTDFVAADAPRALRIVLTKATGAVTGAVETTATPRAGARVILFSTDERRWGAHSRFIRSVTAGGDGRYTIDSLLPGDYAIIAIPFMPEGLWEDPEILRALKPAASPVTIGPLEQVQLALRVKRAP